MERLVRDVAFVEVPPEPVTGEDAVRGERGTPVGIAVADVDIRLAGEPAALAGLAA